MVTSRADPLDQPGNGAQAPTIAMSMNVRKINEESAGDGRVVEFSPYRPTVGEWLREARESYGLKLADVSSTLRIRQTYLEAIEADRFEDLPGATYATGFLRAYSEYLGLDGVAIVQRFREQAGENRGEEELSFPVPKSDNRVPRGAILLMSLALAVVAYGAWYLLQDEETSVVTEAAAPPPAVDEPASVPARAALEMPRAPAPSSIAAQAKQEDPVAPPAAIAETPSVTPAATETPATATEGPGATPADPASRETTTEAAAAATGGEPATDNTAAAPAPEAEATAGAATGGNTPTVPVEPVPKPAAPQRVADASTPVAESVAAPAAPQQTANAPQTASAPPAPPAAPAAVEPDEIVIRAQVDSWVEVRDPDNAPLVSRLLRAGDEYEIPAGQGLKLVTGNAGALSVFVDGNEVPPLAPPGAVRRYIALDAERLRQGTALIE